MSDFLKHLTHPYNSVNASDGIFKYTKWWFGCIDGKTASFHLSNLRIQIRTCCTIWICLWTNLKNTGAAPPCKFHLLKKSIRDLDSSARATFSFWHQILQYSQNLEEPLKDGKKWQWLQFLYKKIFTLDFHHTSIDNADCI